MPSCMTEGCFRLPCIVQLYMAAIGKDMKAASKKMGKSIAANFIIAKPGFVLYKTPMHNEEDLGSHASW